MATIDCPGTDTLNSIKTRTSVGIFEKSNKQTAATRALTSVLSDLTAQVNQVVCQGGCLKVPRQTNSPPPVPTCKRIWWTLWIAIKCSATATGSVVVECVING